LNGETVEKGNFENGKKQIFEYYQKSVLKIKYDFQKDSLVLLNIPKSRFEIYSENKVEIFPESPCLPLVSPFEMTYFIAIKVKYPQEAMENNIQGKVKVGIKINPTGQIIGYEIIKSIHPILDAAAMDVVKSFPAEWKWIPTLYNGEKITSFYVVPVNFVLQ